MIRTDWSLCFISAHCFFDTSPTLCSEKGWVLMLPKQKFTQSYAFRDRAHNMSWIHSHDSRLPKSVPNWHKPVLYDTSYPFVNLRRVPGKGCQLHRKTLWERWFYSQGGRSSSQETNGVASHDTCTDLRAAGLPTVGICRSWFCRSWFNWITRLKRGRVYPFSFISYHTAAVEMTITYGWRWHKAVAHILLS